MADFKTQMVQFAARRVVSEVVRVAAREIEIKARNKARDGKLRKIVKQSSKSDNKEIQKMARYDQSEFDDRSTRQQAERGNGNANKPKEPIDFWVNTVIVEKDGAEPIRILTGRPLKAFKADRKIGTNNDEFNTVNRLNNGFVDLLNADAAELELGESRYYSPAGTPFDKESGEPKFKKGIYLQLHREETDHVAAAAEAEDARASETDRLRTLFGS